MSEIVGDAAAGKDIGHIFNDILEYLRGFDFVHHWGCGPHSEDIIE